MFRVFCSRTIKQNGKSRIATITYLFHRKKSSCRIIRIKMFDINNLSKNLQNLCFSILPWRSKLQLLHRTNKESMNILKSDGDQMFK